ncbi:PQQ-dependent sugar dehydrogenase [Luteolibacter yonseiensis]|uniref:PQQ-dependent sugar dehydrogenase n=1 Tax=Luteolibacter yonseiensis TaxID=1144680 RepID=A0A934R0L5_9BACT|nr:PQQ-dependent sugar dehydrogenase [Luteolibacter yonseiensis]MBK1814542.1 PQQ-dependent sugar dehydrogenase [Luteolibacter yonseiensis]
MPARHVPWSTLFTVVAFMGLIPGPMTALAIEEETPADDVFRESAISHDGDASQGRILFTSMACSQCHSLDGSGGKVGPDLSAIGDKFEKRDLIRAVMEPSSSIAIGYDTTIVTRKDGTVAAGVIKQATDDWVELMSADSSRVRIGNADIARRETAPTSLMPENLHRAGKPEDFTNLVAYLRSLHQNMAGARPEDIPKAGSPAKLEVFFDDAIGFREPVWFGEVPGRANAYVVLEHHGKSFIVEKNAGADVWKPFLDLSGVVRAGGATGLLGMAFHPKFPEDLRYFLKYQIVENGRISTLVMERRFSKDLSGDSGEPARQLIKIPAVTQDHNGGCLAFGPDGYLYFGMGDTGPQDDPQGHGQDMSLLLGKMMRIDIDHQDTGLPYAIPRDNPFRDVEGVRPEIWASGFREPWRFSWDSKTGDLWVGDVGQNRFEEVGIVRAGENHGWNVMEGFNPFSERYKKQGIELTQPVWSYSHRLGNSVTGGYVYRGKKAPAMEGWYIFADHESRRIWALTQKDRKLEKIVEIGQAPARAVSLSQTKDGELYLVGFTSGKIYHLDLGTVDPTPLEVRVLAATAENAPITSRFVTNSPQGDWAAAGYDDLSWTEAPGGFGSPGTPGGVIRTEWRTSDIWLRREFTLPESFKPDEKSQFTLKIHHDEDARVYLNGVEVADLPRWTQGYTEIPLSKEILRTLHPGRNIMAIHCHQNTGGQYIDAGLLEHVAPGDKKAHP